MTLHDNTFGNITFEDLSAFTVKKISTNAFHNTKDKIKTFNCPSCLLVNEPPKYDLRKVLNELTELTILQPDLNVTEIPSTVIQPINGQSSKIYLLSIHSLQNLTIKSGAFQNLKILERLLFYQTSFQKIQKEAFKLNEEYGAPLNIIFDNCNLTDDTFQNGSFNGIQRDKLAISFKYTNISSFNREVFKPVLDKPKAVINMLYGAFVKNSFIDCENCNNLWLIQENKENQFVFPYCKQNTDKTLFDEDIKTKLTKKCL